MRRLIRKKIRIKKAKKTFPFPITICEIFCEIKAPASLGDFDMRFSNEEFSRPSSSWSLTRLPHIRIAVPSLLDGVKRRPDMHKARSNAQHELLEQFKSDMDGFMPQRTLRKKLARRV